MNRSFFVLACILLLCGCSKHSQANQNSLFHNLNIAETTARDANGCIPPQVTFAYPYGLNENYSPPPERNIFPSTEWKIIPVEPILNENGLPNNALEIQFVRQKGDFEELWVTDQVNGNIYVINTDTLTWQKLELKIPYTYQFIILDHNNLVWIVKGSEVDGQPIFYQLIDGNSDIEEYKTKNDVLINYDTTEISAIEIGNDGKFWMILKAGKKNVYNFDYYLYSFDPISKQSQIQLNLDEGYSSSIEFSENGELFLIDNNQKLLIEYSPLTENNKSDKIPYTDDIGALFLDNDEQLWLDDNGWFDYSKNTQNSQWYMVVRSPIFIDYLDAAGIWGWSHPLFLFEDLNHHIWFESQSGTGYLNKEKGIWCLITTYQSHIVKDNKESFWMLVNGLLYYTDFYK